LLTPAPEKKVSPDELKVHKEGRKQGKKRKNYKKKEGKKERQKAGYEQESF